MTHFRRVGLFIGLLIAGILIGFWFGKQSAQSSNYTPAVAISEQTGSAQLHSESKTSSSTLRPLQIDSSEIEGASGYIARLELHSPQEIENALQRAEALHQKLSVGNTENVEPLALVIHGPEVEVFFEKNYSQYKHIVDLAARLSAFNVIDVKVCKRQIDHITNQKPGLPPFVEEVPYGPEEEKRLLENEAYVYF